MMYSWSMEGPVVDAAEAVSEGVSAPESAPVPAPASPRPIKPIPPRLLPAAPGLVREYASGSSIDKQALGLAASTIEEDAQDGDQLMPMPGEGKGEEADEAATPEPAAPEPEPPPTGFNFGGHKFKTQEEAEHFFKSHEGRSRGLQQQNAALERSAREWVAYGDALAARVAELESALAPKEKPQAKPSQNPGSDEDLLSSMDWETYNAMANSHDANIRAASGLHLVQQTLAAVRRMQEAQRAELHEKLAPYEGQREVAQLTEQLTSVFETMAGWNKADGSPIYPEMHDEDSAREILKVWRALPIEADKRFTPQALHLAALHVRTLRGEKSAPTVPPASKAALASAQRVVSSLAERTRSGDAIVGGPTVSPRQRAETAGERVRREMRERPMFNSLGFEP